jgi:hypothetical protein
MDLIVHKSKNVLILNHKNFCKTVHGGTNKKKKKEKKSKWRHFRINKIHGILLTTNSTEFHQKVDQFDKKSLSTEMSYF